MSSVSVYIAGSRTRSTVLQRTTGDFQVMAATLRDDPGTWYVYSIHLNMPAAHNRASRLRRHQRPQALWQYGDNIDFRARLHPEHGAVVLVRWQG